MGKSRTWTEQQLRDACDRSMSIRSVLKELKLQPTGGNYKNIKSHIKSFGIDIGHFTGQGHLKGKTHTWAPKRPLEEVLVENSTYKTSHSLKKRLFNEGVFQRKCYQCERTEWNGQPIPTELEHINGVNTDNRLENLTILCPNCHAQTDTYRGKNSSLSRRFLD